MTNKKASFWKYDGNHFGGRDCERRDPHGFGLEMISYAAFVADGGDTSAPIALQKQIKVSHKRGNGFGHEVEVSAPAAAWAELQRWLKEDQRRWA